MPPIITARLIKLMDEFGIVIDFAKSGGDEGAAIPRGRV